MFNRSEKPKPELAVHLCQNKQMSDRKRQICLTKHTEIERGDLKDPSFFYQKGWMCYYAPFRYSSSILFSAQHWTNLVRSSKSYTGPFFIFYFFGKTYTSPLKIFFSTYEPTMKLEDLQLNQEFSYYILYIEH